MEEVRRADRDNLDIRVFENRSVVGTCLGEAEDVEGMPYLGQLVNDTPGAANVLEYARNVRERSALRGLAATGDAIANLAFRPDGRSVDQIMDEAERRVLAIRSNAQRNESGPQHASVRWGNMVDEIRNANERGGLRGIPSGITNLDLKTRGLVAGDLVIVAGRPSMGKTTLAMNWAEHVALDQRKGVLVFSSEMQTESLLMRLVSARGRIDLNRIRSGDMSDDDWQRLSLVEGEVRDAPLHIDDTNGLTVNDIRARARRQHAKGELGLIVVDYLQRMSIPDTGDGNRSRSVGEVCRQLKDLGSELNVPVVLLSQLNRGVESRDNKRPRMADLRESGEIEQDADLIVFVYRDEVYSEASPDAGTAELIIAKQRNGEIGMVRAAFIGSESRFANLAPGWLPQPQAVAAPSPRGFSRRQKSPSAGAAAEGYP